AALGAAGTVDVRPCRRQSLLVFTHGALSYSGGSAMGLSATGAWLRALPMILHRPPPGPTCRPDTAHSNADLVSAAGRHSAPLNSAKPWPSRPSGHRSTFVREPDPSP